MILAHASLNEIAVELSKALVRVNSTNDMARLSLPLTYPGGSMVGVEISRLRDDFLVTDGGAARREAEMLGGEKTFIRIAHDVAERFAIRFDQNMMFDLDVSRESLLAAVVAVANAAKTAVENTAMHMAAVEHADYGAHLWERLHKLYGPYVVRRPSKIKGASEEWDFDAAIQVGHKFSLYEMVNPNANSVNSAVTKFLDIRDLGDSAPNRVAVVINLRKTPRLPVLGRTARILEINATDDTYRMAA